MLPLVLRSSWQLIAVIVLIGAANPSAVAQAPPADPVRADSLREAASDEQGLAGEKTNEVVAAVSAALEQADSERLLDLATSRIELVLLGQSARYSRGQAMLVLKDFFRRFPPSRVSFSEHSASSDGHSAMGRYWSASNHSPFLLYVGFRVTDSADAQIETVRIERSSFGVADR